MDIFKKLFSLINFENERPKLGSFVFWFCVLAIFIFVDQILKFFIFGKLRSKFFFDAIGLVLFRNYNFAFSLYLPVPLMYAIYTGVIFAILIFLRKQFIIFTKVQTLAWVLILAGAFSNIGERIFLGYVRDFFYIFSGIFNLADAYIIAGIIILVFYSRKPKSTG